MKSEIEARSLKEKKKRKGERRRVFARVTCCFDQALTQVPSVERVHPREQESKERGRRGEGWVRSDF